MGWTRFCSSFLSHFRDCCQEDDAPVVEDVRDDDKDDDDEDDDDDDEDDKEDDALGPLLFH